jgi:hypothetical protein
MIVFRVEPVAMTKAVLQIILHLTWPLKDVCMSMVKRYGRAIAQAVSRWLPTAAARVRARV